MIPRLEFAASQPVRAALQAIGRTEDLRFSPDNRLLVLAGFRRRLCLVLGISIEGPPADPRVTVHDFLELVSPGIGLVHGIDFLDDRTIAVGNRDGQVALFTLPVGELGGRRFQAEPIATVPGSLTRWVRSPGSVATWQGEDGVRRLLVCNNYIHTVTGHVLGGPDGFRPARASFLLHRGLRIPDGITVSHDGRWIAVSSHATHDVKLFDGSRNLGWRTSPAGVLRGAAYPHGLRFTADDRRILVADAGEPLVHVYESDGDWSGARDSVRAVTVLDSATFERGRTDKAGQTNREEGGPKGVDIDRSGRVMALTCQEEPLAFFSMASVAG
ncbi:hypothetical protein [Candidatus Amarobacter glycogenicus]|uniref:hypothetical protein n=1 Tax=Candidatus Amarobacter glycogenicus TaxID=3140699 RepID=UPI002A145F68|nr:hypothetical protein [Dehalococcoidia bacterium]